MQYEIEYGINNFRDDAEDFNVLSGQFNKTSLQDLKNQVALITEEAQETLEAVEQNNITELLDGAVDVMYVTIGLLQKLEQLGVDVNGAMRKVAEDNLAKFPSSQLLAESTVEMYKVQGIETTMQYNDTFGRYVIEDVNDKVRKPAGFVSTYLGAFVPRSLKGL
jgi:NTP pyrophosphatase (non-canonical NTP hydrolase)